MLTSLLFELTTQVQQLVAPAINEYSLLHNSTLLSLPTLALSAGKWHPLALPGSSGSTAEIRLTIPLTVAAASVSIAVLAAADVTRAADALNVIVDVSARAGTGPRNATLTITNEHAPPNLNTKASAVSTFTVLADESEVDVQIFIDRMVVEAFAMGGRGAVVAEEYVNFFPPHNRTAVHMLSHAGDIVLQEVTVFAMGCGWAAPEGRWVE